MGHGDDDAESDGENHLTHGIPLLHHQQQCTRATLSNALIPTPGLATEGMNLGLLVDGCALEALVVWPGVRILSSYVLLEHASIVGFGRIGVHVVW